MSITIKAVSVTAKNYPRSPQVFALLVRKLPRTLPLPDGTSQEATMPEPASGARWKRFAALVVPAAVRDRHRRPDRRGRPRGPFVVSGQNYRNSADETDRDEMVLYGDVDEGLDGAKHPVGDMAIRPNAGGGDTPAGIGALQLDLATIDERSCRPGPSRPGRSS
ncbi:hypothetical protein [Cryptosporangium phraense]|uniref:Uncharacterized protein n=1 Tax=Cryptosporangium phraense TaxID=2593070 RepID=A0A545AT47_9ACTN|nr:hypothetical protein [Cryptosporangium phraense]TQS43775.1 hypothetical protein FL583_17220 [Cryptosporangium phraense]